MNFALSAEAILSLLHPAIGVMNTTEAPMICLGLSLLVPGHAPIGMVGVISTWTDWRYAEPMTSSCDETTAAWFHRERRREKRRERSRILERR